MIIAAGDPVWPTPLENNIAVDDLLRRMDRSGGDRAVTCLQPLHGRSEIEERSAYVHRAMRQRTGRILGFGWVNPTPGRERTSTEVRRCVDEYGFYGIKLNGTQNEFVIDDPDSVLPVVEAIAESGTVLALRVGADANERTHPTWADTLARRFPDLRVLMVQIGGDSLPRPLANRDRGGDRTPEHHPSRQRGPRHLDPHRDQASGGGANLLGTDTPFALMHVETAKCRALVGGEADQAKVLGDTIARVLGLAVPAPS